jgi:hypothetical protein
VRLYECAQLHWALRLGQRAADAVYALRRQDNEMSNAAGVHNIAMEAIQAYLYYDAETDVGSERAMEMAAALVAGNCAALPTIVCLCGSTRFWRLFQQAGLRETMAGKIVLSIGAASGTDDEHFGNLPQAEYDRIKTILDDLHMRKIDLADEVLILNHEGYIGESTARELAYAQQLGKVVRYWSDEQ